MRKVFFLAAGLSLMITQTGCFGSFGLIQKVYEFNDGISDNKIVKTLFFYVLNIVPVYGIAGFLDAVIFNLIEFWSGSNPLAMEEGQYEEQFLTIKGESYKIAATKNQMAFHKLVDGELIDMGAMKFDDTKQTWSFEKDGQTADLIQFDGNNVNFNTAKGTQTVDINNMDCIALNENWNSTSFAFASK